MRHRGREAFAARHPCHVTLKVRPDIPSLRTVRVVRAFERSLAVGCERGDFRVVHYSLQSNHAHLIVEARGREALGRGMKSVGARLGKAVNRALGRQGPVLADRYHARVLRTPLEVRRAIRYVLLNARRHARRRPGGAQRLDPASSARWFDGWRRRITVPAIGPPPVSPAHSWLLSAGWRRHGLLDPEDVPGAAPGQL